MGPPHITTSLAYINQKHLQKKLVRLHQIKKNTDYELSQAQSTYTAFSLNIIFQYTEAFQSLLQIQGISANPSRIIPCLRRKRIEKFIFIFHKQYCNTLQQYILCRNLNRHLNQKAYSSCNKGQGEITEIFERGKNDAIAEATK